MILATGSPLNAAVSTRKPRSRRSMAVFSRYVSDKAPSSDAPFPVDTRTSSKCAPVGIDSAVARLKARSADGDPSSGTRIVFNIASAPRISTLLDIEQIDDFTDVRYLGNCILYQSQFIRIADMALEKDAMVHHVYTNIQRGCCRAG